MAAFIQTAGATGSGSMTIQGPNTNSTQVVSVPDSSGTMMVSGNMPAFSAYQSSAQTALSVNTWTKLQFQTKEFDTNVVAFTNNPLLAVWIGDVNSPVLGLYKYLVLPV